MSKVLHGHPTQYNWGINYLMGDPARGMALRPFLLFIASIVVGNTIPEMGDILALQLKINPHFFNIFFLFLGVGGVYYSFYLGRKERVGLS